MRFHSNVAAAPEERRFQHKDEALRYFETLKPDSKAIIKVLSAFEHYNSIPPFPGPRGPDALTVLNTMLAPFRRDALKRFDSGLLLVLTELLCRIRLGLPQNTEIQPIKSRALVDIDSDPVFRGVADELLRRLQERTLLSPHNTDTDVLQILNQTYIAWMSSHGNLPKVYMEEYSSMFSKELISALDFAPTFSCLCVLLHESNKSIPNTLIHRLLDHLATFSVQLRECEPSRILFLLSSIHKKTKEWHLPLFYVLGSNMKAYDVTLLCQLGTYMHSNMDDATFARKETIPSWCDAMNEKLVQYDHIDTDTIHTVLLTLQTYEHPQLLSKVVRSMSQHADVKYFWENTELLLKAIAASRRFSRKERGKIDLIVNQFPQHIVALNELSVLTSAITQCRELGREKAVDAVLKRLGNLLTPRIESNEISYESTKSISDIMLRSKECSEDFFDAVCVRVADQFGPDIPASEAVDWINLLRDQIDLNSYLIYEKIMTRFIEYYLAELDEKHVLWAAITFETAERDDLEESIIDATRRSIKYYGLEDLATMARVYEDKFYLDDEHVWREMLASVQAQFNELSTGTTPISADNVLLYLYCLRIIICNTSIRASLVEPAEKHLMRLISAGEPGAATALPWLLLCSAFSSPSRHLFESTFSNMEAYFDEEEDIPCISVLSTMLAYRKAGIPGATEEERVNRGAKLASYVCDYLLTADLKDVNNSIYAFRHFAEDYDMLVYIMSAFTANLRLEEVKAVDPEMSESLESLQIGDLSTENVHSLVHMFLDGATGVNVDDENDASPIN